MLRNAKGLAIITVLKAGFLFSGRAGLGVIVARLPDGSWLAPLGIITTGAGVGGQIGAEITDFVFILNSKSAVDSFAQIGSVTLGTNVSVAAGPLGRNAEAAGTASLRSASAVFAYSKTKGLFAGVSLEGLAIVERRDANRKFYGEKIKARNILAGDVEAPPACDALMRVLNSRVFSERAMYDDMVSDGYYSDIPDDLDSSSSSMRDSASSRRGSRRRGGGGGRNNRTIYSDSDSDQDSLSDTYPLRRSPSSNGRNQPSKSSWQDKVYDTSPASADVDDLKSRMRKANISTPETRSLPASLRGQAASATQAIALYTFKGEQPGDLPFRKGDVIDIVKRSDTADDWWTGINNGLTGIFPANYVELL